MVVSSKTVRGEELAGERRPNDYEAGRTRLRDIMSHMPRDSHPSVTEANSSRATTTSVHPVCQKTQSQRVPSSYRFCFQESVVTRLCPYPKA